MIKPSAQSNQMTSSFKFITQIIFFSLFITFLTTGFNLENLNLNVQAQPESSPSAISDEQIKQNIKDRLKQAISNQPADLIKKAWVGSLESIANHTLTINTRDGPKLASVSAETTFIRLPKRETIEIEDLEIDIHTIAIGYLNGNQVLNAKRIIINEDPPTSPQRNVYFITILDYDQENQTITIKLDQGESQTLELTKNTLITNSANGYTQEVSLEEIKPNTNAVIIIKIETVKNKETTSVTNLHLIPNQDSPTEPIQQVIQDSTESSPSSQ